MRYLPIHTANRRWLCTYHINCACDELMQTGRNDYQGWLVVESATILNIVAVRHQREDDYH